jgi:hypothetical protein
MLNIAPGKLRETSATTKYHSCLISAWIVKAHPAKVYLKLIYENSIYSSIMFKLPVNASGIYWAKITHHDPPYIDCK